MQAHIFRSDHDLDWQLESFQGSSSDDRVGEELRSGEERAYGNNRGKRGVFFFYSFERRGHLCSFSIPERRKEAEAGRREQRREEMHGEAMLIPSLELGDSERFPTFYGFPLRDSATATRLSTVGDDNDFACYNRLRSIHDRCVPVSLF